MRSEFETKH